MHVGLQPVPMEKRAASGLSVGPKSELEGLAQQTFSQLMGSLDFYLTDSVG